MDSNQGSVYRIIALGGGQSSDISPKTPLPWEFTSESDVSSTDRMGDKVGPETSDCFPMQLLTQTPHPPTRKGGLAHPNSPPPFLVRPPSVAGLFTQGQLGEESSLFEKEKRKNKQLVLVDPSTL